MAVIRPLAATVSWVPLIWVALTTLWDPFNIVSNNAKIGTHWRKGYINYVKKDKDEQLLKWMQNFAPLHLSPKLSYFQSASPAQTDII